MVEYCWSVFYFFSEKLITPQTYVDFLTEYLSPQLEQYRTQVIFQQNSPPRLCGLEFW